MKTTSEIAMRFRPRAEVVYEMPVPLSLRIRRATRACARWERRAAARITIYLRALLQRAQASTSPRVRDKAMDDLVVAALRQGAFGGISTHFDDVSGHARTQVHSASPLARPHIGRSFDDAMAEVEATMHIRANGRLSHLALLRERARRFGRWQA